MHIQEEKYTAANTKQFHTLEYQLKPNTTFYFVLYC